MNKSDELDFFDFEKGFLQHVLSLVDEHIKGIEEWAKKLEDPDAFGVYEDIDHLVGIGFVACQRYLTGTCAFWKADKAQALDLPPICESGIPLVAALNAAANYWKHHDDWQKDSPRPEERRTKQILVQLGYSPDDNYILGNILHDLTGGDMQALLPPLLVWRNAVVALKERQGP